MIRLLLLGALEISGPDPPRDPAAVARRPALVALLVYLALEGRPFCSRDLVQAMFWPEHDHGHARHNLNQAVYAIRRQLGPGSIADRGATQLGLGNGEIWCDATAFSAAVADGDLAGALELYRGDLLPGFYLRDAPRFEEWLEQARTGLRRRAGRAALDQAVAEERAGSARGAVRYGRRAAQLSSDEVALQAVIRLLDRLGDRAAAVHVFDEFRHRLTVELGVEPSPETLAMIRAVRRRATPHHRADD